MDKDDKLPKSKSVVLYKTVCVVVTVVYVFNIVCNEIVKIEDNPIAKAAQKDTIIESFKTGQITTTEAARYLSKLGCSDKEVNTIVSQTDNIHEPSGILYSSDRIRWKTDQSELPFWPSSAKTNSGRWEILTESSAWEALPPSTSRTSNGKSDLAREFAISFSEQAQENPKLQRDLGEGEVDSYSETHAYKFRDYLLPSPLGEKGETERYELVGPPYMWIQPAGFRNSIFGRGVIIFAVVAFIGVIVKKWVFKPKETGVETKQNDSVTNKRKKAPPQDDDNS